MARSELGFRCVKVVAVAAEDLDRASAFYGNRLGLPAEYEDGEFLGFSIGDTIVMPKVGWYGRPTGDPNPRITFQVRDARETEIQLRERNVTISDPVEPSGRHFVGSFLDSEGNKLWFCS